jgi:hypothetical protein
VKTSSDSNYNSSAETTINKFFNTKINDTSCEWKQNCDELQMEPTKLPSKADWKLAKMSQAPHPVMNREEFQHQKNQQREKVQQLCSFIKENVNKRDKEIYTQIEESRRFLE